ncbi:hypothetical protein H4Q26_017475 [Puccinia striiformis f. sp. tritici PST-130]|nr:hypothetical protein H4Q26_017475 [Puccinia striiformis f. sp. tritici PST-130]
MSRSTSGESAPKRRATEPAIQSVEYGNAESVGSSRWAKLIRFDIVCVTDTNQIVDIEMQVAAENHFIDRLTFYSSRLITERQGWPGNRVPTNLLDQTVQNTLGCELVKQRGESTQSLCNYQLKPVYIIAICDFAFSCLPLFPAPLQKAWFCGAATFFDESRTIPTPTSFSPHLVPFNNSAHYCLISLPSFEMAPEACNGTLERIVWLLHNLGSEGQFSQPIPDWAYSSDELQHFMKVVYLQGLSPQAHHVYQQELSLSRSYESSIQCAEDRAWAEGRQEGRQQAMKEAKEARISSLDSC